MGAVPAIDLGPVLRADQVATMRAALLGGSPCDGSFYVVNHGVPQAVVDELFAEVGGFMRLPLAEKMRSAPDFGSPMDDGSGYYAHGWSEARDSKEFWLEAGLDKNPLEFYMLKTSARALPRNVYPDRPGFRDAAEAYMAAVVAMARRLLPIIALALGLPEDAFDDAFSDATGQLRANHYPPAGARPDLNAVAVVGPHTDSSFMTLLPQHRDQPAGLEVQLSDGGWHRPEP